QIAETTFRPSFLRTTFQLFWPSTVTDSVVPCRAGWSVPSATIVSTAPGPKVRAYLFPPTASTFISSVSLLLDGFTLHLPTKGSLAAHDVPTATKTTSSERRLRCSIGIPEASRFIGSATQALSALTMPVASACDGQRVGANVRTSGR